MNRRFHSPYSLALQGEESIWEFNRRQVRERNGNAPLWDYLRWEMKRAIVAHRKDHPKKYHYSQKAREHYISHRAELLRKAKTRRENNLERYRSQSRAYSASHRAEMGAYAKEWWAARKNDPARIARHKALHRRWLDSMTTPERKALYALKTARNRARGKNVTHEFTKQELLSLLLSTEGRCVDCGENVGWKVLTLDHILPLSRVVPGHAYGIDGVRFVCFRCNVSKGGRLIPELLSCSA